MNIKKNPRKYEIEVKACFDKIGNKFPKEFWDNCRAQLDPLKAEIEAKEKAKADSIAAVEKAKTDSIAAADAAAAAEAEAKAAAAADSARVADSIAAAANTKGGKK